MNTSSPDYPGARYPYIAANTIDREGKMRLPPYLVIRRAGVRVGFIGVTTPSTPKFLVPRYARRFRFTDISTAVTTAPALPGTGLQLPAAWTGTAEMTITVLGRCAATGGTSSYTRTADLALQGPVLGAGPTTRARSPSCEYS